MVDPDVSVAPSWLIYKQRSPMRSSAVLYCLKEHHRWIQRPTGTFDSAQTADLDDLRLPES